MAVGHRDADLVGGADPLGRDGDRASRVAGEAQGLGQVDVPTPDVVGVPDLATDGDRGLDDLDGRRVAKDGQVDPERAERMALLGPGADRAGDLDRLLAQDP